MNSAIWLILALPEWYFSASSDPLGAGLLTIIPATGVVFLLIGVVQGFVTRERRLLLFIVPFLASELFVGIAGALRGAVAKSPAGIVLLLFIAIQAIVAGTLVYRLRRAWAPASSLAIFSMSYALFACFVAGMAFADDWI